MCKLKIRKQEHNIKKGEDKMKRIIGMQPMVSGTAYHLGLQCPIGGEPHLLVQLKTYFPELPFHEARDVFFEGLADRFVPEVKRKQREWDGVTIKLNHNG